MSAAAATSLIGNAAGFGYNNNNNNNKNNQNDSNNFNGQIENDNRTTTTTCNGSVGMNMPPIYDCLMDNDDDDYYNNCEELKMNAGIINKKKSAENFTVISTDDAVSITNNVAVKKAPGEDDEEGEAKEKDSNVIINDGNRAIITTNATIETTSNTESNTFSKDSTILAVPTTATSIASTATATITTTTKTPSGISVNNKSSFNIRNNKSNNSTIVIIRSQDNDDEQRIDDDAAASELQRKPNEPCDQQQQQQQKDVKEQLLDTAANDSGRESVNDFDSLLEDLQQHQQQHRQQQSLHKKQCTSEFYASDGSQTKWYLNPNDIGMPTGICQKNIEDEHHAIQVVTVKEQTDESSSKIESNAFAEEREKQKQEQQHQLKKDSENFVKIHNNEENAKNAEPQAMTDTSQEETRIPIAPGTTSTTTTITILPQSNNNEINLKDSVNITQFYQRRAESSPSLSETSLMHGEDKARGTSASGKHLTTVNMQDQKPCTSKASNIVNDETSSTSQATGGASKSSQTFGMLQKFKQHFHRYSHHQLSSVGNSGTLEAASSASSLSTASTTLTVEADIHCESENAAANQPIAVYASTLSIGGEAAPSGKLLFGSSMWRTSKERRKGKFNRRDKCNSGDSGIHIELENDEHIMKLLSNVRKARNKSCIADDEESMRRKIREEIQNALENKNCTIEEIYARVHSLRHADSAREELLRHLNLFEREAPESMPVRSLSHPNGLNNIGKEPEENRDNCPTDPDDGQRPIYAEVLHNFSAAGPQELGLERGNLIEILRKDGVQWWFGRINKQNASRLSEVLDPELGWFPKDFVRVIPLAQHERKECLANETHLNPSCTQTQKALGPSPTESVDNSKRTPPSSLILPRKSLADDGHFEYAIEDTDNANCANEAFTDRDNITTIIIDPSSTQTTPTTIVDIERAMERQFSDLNFTNTILSESEIKLHSAIRELLATEISYVKLLSSICEGYLPAMKKRIDIFTPQSIDAIFSNIAEIYEFQHRFLVELCKGIEAKRIADVFMRMHEEFMCYSTYCNSYPRALIEIEFYERKKDAHMILDNVRESENLNGLPLSAHLLAPVQRICRYPLHLTEIIKAFSKCGIPYVPTTPSNDSSMIDSVVTLNMALKTMKHVAEAVNEGKRHSEMITNLQASFRNFKGPPLYLNSTRFFLQIDATIRKNNIWNSSYTLFLFERQLVYCKRDMLKRSQYIYKGRIFLDRCHIINIRNGHIFGQSVKNSLRIFCEVHNKFYDLCFRSSNRKQRFLNTLAMEREFVSKQLVVTEMPGFEYSLNEQQSNYGFGFAAGAGVGVGAAGARAGTSRKIVRHARGDLSDQSDYEINEYEYEYSAPRSLRDIYLQECGTATSGSGESSVPDSPTKPAMHKHCETLPKKSKSRDALSDIADGYGTSSMGRRHNLGKWIRLSRSSNNTPFQSPINKPPTPTVLLPTSHSHLAEIQLPKSIEESNEEEDNVNNSNTNQKSNGNAKKNNKKKIKPPIIVLNDAKN